MRFTGGEQFFPMDVDRYVRACSLWLYHPDDHDEEMIPEGELTTEALAESRAAAFGSVFYLRFIAPMSIEASARALAGLQRLKRQQRYNFRTGLGRLARGGLLPRLLDALFSATLLLRGRVPKATAAAAVLSYSEMQEGDERYVYYGRVARHSGWTICQYWLFFAYNNWRSGFHGVNDHESDWELVSVYLYERDGRLVPEWVAFASHDYHGDDLRRRWDDRDDLTLEGGHPVVHAGAGSHAAYFSAGEYPAEVPLRLPERLRDPVEALQRFWRKQLGQQRRSDRGLHAPFIDFARGDGLSVGPGQEHEWTPIQVDESTPWAGQYRGLWGLYAQDPISGENAPAGPMYNRDGTPRPSWFDPLGFAGLERVPPPPAELKLLEDESGTLASRQDELDELIPREAALLQERGARLESMEGQPHLERQHRLLAAQVAELSRRLKELRRERVENEAVLESMTRRLERLREGRRDDPRAHIRNAARPIPPPRMRFGRAAEVFAAASLSLLLLGMGVLIAIAPEDAPAGVGVLLIAVVVGESVLRATFVPTVNRVAVVLALVATVILVVQFWRPLLVGGLAVLAVFLIGQRIRESRA
jgi:hypothetical protein